MNNPKYLQQLLEIKTGKYGDPVEDRGGYYSKELNVWVDGELELYLQNNQDKLELLNLLAGIAIQLGQLHKKQLDDAKNYTIWPKKYFQNNFRALLEDISTLKNIEDPFSVISSDGKVTPYSWHYKNQTEKLIELLNELVQVNTQEALDLKPYITALIKTYTPNNQTTSDLENYRAQDLAWVNTPASVQYLIFAEPTEVYQDPMRIDAGKIDVVNQWVSAVEDKIGLSPWRNFFEFRLMAKEENMVSQTEVLKIRDTSIRLFSSASNLDIKVSLEFRKLLFGAGQGAYPAKTAKNYPNFGDIRANTGYKNVLYTNMLQNATSTEAIPTLKKYLKQNQLFNDPNLEQDLTRGRSLLVVAHEENHPYRRMTSLPLEELKSTVNGLIALINCLSNDKDVNMAILGAIAGAFVSREKTVKAREQKDVNAERAMEAYYVEDVILMNWLDKDDVFTFTPTKKTINMSKAKLSLVNLAEYLYKIHLGNLGTEEIFNKYNKEEIWKKWN